MTIRWNESDLRDYQARRGLVRRPGAMRSARCGVIAEMSPDRLCVTLPVRLRSLANERGTAMTRHRWLKSQRAAVRGFLSADMLPVLPARVKITRLGLRKMDTDNLTISAKAVRDAIAELYGVDDGSDLYEWRVEQETAKAFGVRIEIERR